jgi:RIO-like serine/threonine protein kinase
MNYMLKKFLQKVSDYLFKKSEPEVTDEVSDKEYEMLDRLKRNAFHTPNPELRDKLQAVVKIEEKPLTKTDAVNAEFNTINWQVLDTETKEQLIKIAREAIANEIASRQPIPPAAYMTTIKK